MAESEPDSSAESADDKVSEFDREKWTTERQFRERELELRERELRRGRSMNALIIAIFTAAAAGAANFAVAYHNGQQQSKIESVKAEHALVLEAIRTNGDVAKSKANLEFLVDTHLLTDQRRRARITEYLSKNRAPTLATTGGTASSGPRHYDFAVLNDGAIDPDGWEVDVFSCPTGGEIFSAAERFVELVADRADVRGRIGGERLGRIRFETGQSWRRRNEIHFDPNEQSFARAIGDEATRLTGRQFTLVPNTEGATPYYVSVYFCEG